MAQTRLADKALRDGAAGTISTLTGNTRLCTLVGLFERGVGCRSSARLEIFVGLLRGGVGLAHVPVGFGFGTSRGRIA
jgi:hypothetical protein